MSYDQQCKGRAVVDRETQSDMIVITGGLTGHIQPEYDFSQNMTSELSRTFYYFLRHGGRIHCEVIGHRKFGVGLEVPCRYTLSGKPRYIKILVKLLAKKTDMAKKSEDRARAS